MSISGPSLLNTPIIFEADIDFISQSGDEIRIINVSPDISGDVPGDNLEIDAGKIQVISEYDTLKYSYGLIANNESENYASKLTNTEQSWIIEGIDYATNTFKEGIPRGPEKGWVTGSTKVKFVSKSDYYGSPIAGKKSLFKYEIVQDFILLPFWENGQDQNLKALTPTPLFFGNSAIKHLAKFEFFRTLAEQNSVKRGTFAVDSIGNSGWFNENFNGLPNDFSFDTLKYFDSLNDESERINSAEKTKVTVNLNSASGLFSSDSPLVIYHAILPDPTIYQLSQDNFTDTWVYEAARAITGIPSSEGQITDITATYVNDNLITLEFFIEFTAAQKQRIDDGQAYVLAVGLADDDASPITSDKKVTLLLDFNTSEKDTDIPGLLTFDKLEIYPHTDNFPNAGYSDGKFWNEDGILIDYDFTLDLTKRAVLESLSVKIAAYNPTTEDSFTIQNEEISLTGITLVAGVQRINLSDSQGFNLPDGSQFNFIKLKDTAGDANSQSYSGQLGLKINWQEWNALAGADTIFYDDTQPNNGLNEKTSNYSELNGYEIRIFIDAVVSQDGQNTLYRHSSPKVIVSDYDKEPAGSDNWEPCLIETFDSENNNLNGALKSGDNNKIKVTFTPKAPFDPVLDDFYGIIRIEEAQQPGFNIWESSTADGIAANSPLTEVSISKVGGNIILECETNPLFLTDVAQKISAKIDTKFPGDYLNDDYLNDDYLT